MTANGDATLLAQLSDPHIVVGRGDRGSSVALAKAVEAVLGLERPPDAVLVSGDLVDEPGGREYSRVTELLAPLPMPTYVLAGNHDDRDALRECFFRNGDAGAPGEELRYSVRIGPLRLLVCDTTLPGLIEGSLDRDRRLWLEAELAAERQTPTILALHHPPIEIGMRPFDAIGMPAADRVALGDILAVHPQVRRVVAGHVHRGAFGVLGGCGAMTCPSTHLQAPLEIPGEELRLVPDAPAFALHAAIDGEVISHLQPLEG